MEFLNTIWNAVSTPNPTLLTIISIPLAFFIEIPLTFLLITTLFKLSYTKKQKYTYIILASISSIINMFLLKNPYNIAFNFLTNFIIVYFVFRIDSFKNLIATVFPSIIFNILGALILNPYLTILNIDYD